MPKIIEIIPEDTELERDLSIKVGKRLVICSRMAEIDGEQGIVVEDAELRPLIAALQELANDRFGGSSV